MIKTHVIACALSTSILTLFTFSVSANNAAPTPAPSEYPDSSGPIWFDPADTLKNVHITLKKHPGLKIPMYSMRNENSYDVCFNLGDEDMSCVIAKSEVWGNYFKDTWGICPIFYTPIDTNTKKVLKKDGNSYTCLLRGSPEWRSLRKP